MSALVLFLGVALTIGVAAFVLYPLLRGTSEGGSGRLSTDDLLARRDRVYGEIKDLEFDQRVGKVTDDDYRDARERLEVEAARILQALDERLRVFDEQIEREVKQLRAKRSGCPSCGAAITPNARFCAACGAQLKVATKR